MSTRIVIKTVDGLQYKYEVTERYLGPCNPDGSPRQGRRMVKASGPVRTTGPPPTTSSELTAPTDALTAHARHHGLDSSAGASTGKLNQVDDEHVE